MSSLWLIVVVTFVILPILFLIRGFILSMFLKFFAKQDPLVISFRINSIFWISIFFVYFLIETSYIWLFSFNFDQKIVSTIRVLLSNLEKFLVFLLIVSIFIFVSAVIVQVIRYYVSKSNVPVPNVEIFYNLLRILVVLIGIITGLWYLGIPMAPIVTTLGIGGLAVSLALQGILSNFFSGMNILFSRVFSKGDYIKVDDRFEGVVDDITWFNTRLIMRNNNTIIIPNSKIVNSVVINYSNPFPPMRIIVPLSVSYSCDLEKVERVVFETASFIQRNVQGANPEFQPIIRFSSFSEYFISLNVILEVLDSDSQFLVIHEFIKRIKKEFDREGIQIPFNPQVVYLRGYSNYFSSPSE
ncbi:MAG: mechanosensitive ion channel family protein [Candidatus Calescibacterium sp.]|nr:mechanosensitive ion channel family protein [Candidatus Calescibacterium sp.]MCX7972305.1 mechanosensitive ion channel family protein [bacterium]MDW8195091.1 mechanosensitive ion channel family protein [Candidatus Calescibacterium sp.]